jgi:hypothetical protein
MRIELNEPFSYAMRQVRVMDCGNNLWPALAEWCWFVIPNLYGPDWKPPTPMRGFATFMRGNEIFQSKRAYDNLSSWMITGWKSLCPSEADRLRAMIVTEPGEQPDTHTRYRAVTAFCNYTLREAFGNIPDAQAISPFRPDATCTAIAQAIREGSMDHPILADALEDAGFDYHPALDHLRNCRHITPRQPCWAVYMSLGLHPYQANPD